MHRIVTVESIKDDINSNVFDKVERKTTCNNCKKVWNQGDWSPLDTVFYNEDHGIGEQVAKSTSLTIDKPDISADVHVCSCGHVLTVIISTGTGEDTVIPEYVEMTEEIVTH